MRIINLTPHEITLFTDDKTYTFASAGIARAEQTVKTVGQLDPFGIDEIVMEFGEPVGLPDRQEGTIYIVSLVTANSAKAHGRNTDDLRITALPVRNDQGQIIGCKALARI